MDLVRANYGSCQVHLWTILGQIFGYFCENFYFTAERVFKFHTMDNFNPRDISMKYVNIGTMLGPCLDHIGIIFCTFLCLLVLARKHCIVQLIIIQHNCSTPSKIKLSCLGKHYYHKILWYGTVLLLLLKLAIYSQGQQKKINYSAPIRHIDLKF